MTQAPPVLAPMSAPAERVHTDTRAVIKVAALEKVFTRVGGEVVTAVDHVDLEVQPAEIVTLVGPSGCGKTTLLRCIAGLEVPTSGSISIDGRVVYDSVARTFIPPERRGISMMFQSYALWPHMTVEKNVGYPLAQRKTSRSVIRQRVREILDVVGIGDLGEQMPGALSGGQQQRVALARSLIVEPKVVLFDEPLSNVDAKVREKLRIEILEMHRKLDFAALYVTHDQEEAMQMGQRLAVVERGQLAQVGTPKSIYDHPCSRYVANFVGRINEWDGVLHSRADSLVVEADGIAMSVVPDNVVEGCMPGAPVTAIVRPEAIKLSTQGAATFGNAFPGEVRAAMFVGSHSEYVVEVGGRAVVVWSSEPLEIAEGERVMVSFGSSQVKVVPR